MDPISATFMTFGVILLAISWIYLLIVAFKADFSWGLIAFFLPFVGYIYAFSKRDKESMDSLWVGAAGIALMALASIL